MAYVVKLSGFVAVTLAMFGVALTAARWQRHREIDEGVLELSRGDHAAAVRTLLRAVTVEPENARAHYYLGLAYGRVGARAGAISQLRDAVRLAPGDPKFHATLGLAYRESGDQASAMRELKEAARLDPATLEYRIGMAGALLDAGDATAAVDGLREAARLAPRAPEVHLLLATALGRAGERDAMEREYAAVGPLLDGGPLAELAWQERHHMKLQALVNE